MFRKLEQRMEKLLTTGTVGGVEVEINVTIIHWSFSCKISEPICTVVTTTHSPRTQKKKKKKGRKEPSFHESIFPSNK